MNRIRLVLVFAIASAGCPSIDNDGNEVTTGPTVQFDPSGSVIPFPNNLVRNPADGRVNLPQQCNESPAQTALRTGTLNQLNGFGTFKTAMNFTLDAPLDPDTDQATLHANIKVFKRATGTTPVDPASATEVPILIQPSSTFRYDNGCTMPPVQVSSVIIVPFITDANGAPVAPITLEENSTYDVMIGTGLHADDMMAGMTTGPTFVASFTWTFVRQTDNPVTVDQGGNIVAERTPLDPTDPADQATLLGVDLLWKAHKQALDFVTAAAEVTRDDVALLWEFTTQTTTAQLDPTAATGPAAAITGEHFLMGSVTGAQTPDEYLTARLGPATCGLIGCASIGAILGGTTNAPQYQALLPNPGGFADIPGQWSDPISPAEVQLEPLEVAAFLPQGAPPAGGWPTVVFGHGLGSSKTSLAILAPMLARAGFASIAIDFVAHGSRAKRISNSAAIGCNDNPNPPDPTVAPQCFQAIFSANLGQTRDNIRQTVIDLQQVIASAKTCTPANPCGALQVDADNMGYIGISLGGIMGSMVVAEAEGLEAGVTNVAGGGLIDVIENTQTLAIKCSLVNALIDAGVVIGDKWDPTVDPTVGICLTEDWKTQPGYRQFAVIARWVLDPADPANFAAKLATRTSLLQEVMGDKVVPNIATDQLGALSGRTPIPGDIATEFPQPPPTAAVAGATTSLWVRYTNLPADPGLGFPGNTFHHASLLRPNEDATMNPTPAEILGWSRIRVDAVEFLSTNVIDN
jgi:hypothetical protein